MTKQEIIEAIAKEAEVTQKQAQKVFDATQKVIIDGIKKGRKGDAVKKLQQILNDKGYKLSVDGDFGSKTDAAVRAYQKANHLEVDGEVGEKTWGSLFA